MLILCCTLSYGQSDPSQRINDLIKIVGENRYKDPLIAGTSALEALRIAQSNGLKKEEAIAFKALGGVQYIKGNYEKSLDNFLSAYNTFEDLKDTTNMSQLLSNLGLVYKNIGDNEKSLTYYEQALDLQSNNPDTLTVSRLLNNVGVIYKNLSRYQETLGYFNRSLELKVIISDHKGVANTYTNLGVIKSKQGDDKSAIRYFYKSLDMERTLQSQEGIAKNFNNLALSYSIMGKCDSAIHFAQQGLEIGEKLQTKIQVKEAAEILASCLARNGEYRKAFYYQALGANMKDSLMNEDKSREIGRLESKLELAAQEAEINILEAKNQLSAAELARKQILQGSLIVAIILVMGISIYIVITQRQKNFLKEQALMGELTELHDQIKMLMTKHGEPYETDLDSLNEKLVEPLSTREFEALKLTIEGKQNREIAESLFISTNTVKFHLRNIYTKLGVNNRKEALEYVVKST